MQIENFRAELDDIKKRLYSLSAVLQPRAKEERKAFIGSNHAWPFNRTWTSFPYSCALANLESVCDDLKDLCFHISKLETEEQNANKI